MEEEKLISEFNEAKFQIFRLHNIWLDCRFYRENGLLEQYRWKLDSAEIELSEDIKRLSNKNNPYTTKFKKLNKEIDKVFLDEKNINKQHHYLKQKEILLRDIQDKAGKGARRKPEDEDRM